MSATTCTVSPVLVKVTVPVTLLPEAECRTAIALVGSWAGAANASAHIIPNEMISVFMRQTYGHLGAI